MISPRILYVEDDINLSFVTKDNLDGAGFAVTHCATGQDALTLFAPGQFDLCVLDVMLPQTDGFTLARHIRRHDPHIPILFLSALADKDNRLAGLRLGADDYLTKPFSIDELVLKINVFLRRSRKTSGFTEPPALEAAPAKSIGQYRFDPADCTLTRAGTTQSLTQRECDVLAYLLARANVLVRRDDLLRALWGDNDYFMGRSLDVFISRLRKRLADDPAVQIENLHGVGFRLKIS